MQKCSLKNEALSLGWTRVWLECQLSARFVSTLPVSHPLSICLIQYYRYKYIYISLWPFVILPHILEYYTSLFTVSVSPAPFGVAILGM